VSLASRKRFAPYNSNDSLEIPCGLERSTMMNACVCSFTFAAAAALPVAKSTRTSAISTPKKKPKAPPPRKSAATSPPGSPVNCSLPVIALVHEVKSFSYAAQGKIKPKEAAIFAYLGQTLRQAIRVAQRECSNAHDTDTWRRVIRYGTRTPALPQSPQSTSAKMPNPEPNPQRQSSPRL
jgi:hypothetical protein